MPKPQYRKMWMFPRNIRRITPWKIVQVAAVLSACSGPATDQEVQDELYGQLERLGVKVPRNEYGVANAGGMRTYFAQLACLGLFWRVPDRGVYLTTHAGDELMRTAEPVRVLRCQVLRMQYPSAYGFGNNVRVSPELRVKPFVFLLDLLQEPKLKGWLTQDEIAVAVVYGRTFRDFDSCVEKILKLRAGLTLRDVIRSVDDVRTPKRWHENDPETDLDSGITDARNIANTAKNYMQAVGLIEPDASDATRYVLTTDECALKDIVEWSNRNVDAVDSDERMMTNWQQRYGRYDQTQAPRRPDQKTAANGLAAMVQLAFRNAVSTSPCILDVSEFIAQTALRWSRPESEIGRIIEPLLPAVPSMEREAIQQFCDSKGERAIELEHAMTAVFKKLGFEESEHVGQKVAPNRLGGFPDIRVLSKAAGVCGFADTKATPNYGFGAGDVVKLGAYYKDCAAEFEDKMPSSFFIYIAGGFRQSVDAMEKRLRQAGDLYGHPVSAIPALALFDLAAQPDRPTAGSLGKAFLRGGFFATAAEIAAAAKAAG